MRNLTKLFIEVGGLYSSWHVSFSVVDIDIPCYEHRLGKFYDFHGNKERDWNHISEQKDPREENFEKDLEVNVPIPWLFIHAFLFSQF